MKVSSTGRGLFWRNMSNTTTYHADHLNLFYNILQDAFSSLASRKIGEVWSTYSNIPGSTAGSFTQYGIMFAADICRTFSVRVKDLHFDSVRNNNVVCRSLIDHVMVGM